MKSAVLSTPIDLAFTPVDNQRLANLCGPLDGHLRQIEASLKVTISRRGENVQIDGPAANVEKAEKVLRALYQSATRELHVEDVQLHLIEVLAAQPEGTETLQAPILLTRRGDLRGRTPRQIQYLNNIQNHDITFGVGPAGTGKTYLAVACAVDALQRDKVKRLVLVRPAVEAGEKLGFLPGDLAQKVDPYLRPLYDALYDLMGFEKVEKLFERSTIEIAPLAYMRGRTLNH